MQGDGGPQRPQAPGPIPLPWRMRSRSARLGWIVAALVVAAAIVLYFAAHQHPPTHRNAAPPTWGSLTLVHIAQSEAAAAGDAHPRSAVWLLTSQRDALPLLVGTVPATSLAVYLVSIRGAFVAPATYGETLEGSQASGSGLVLLVSAFDGDITGRLITDDTYPKLGTLGIVYNLNLGR